MTSMAINTRCVLGDSEILQLPAHCRPFGKRFLLATTFPSEDREGLLRQIVDNFTSSGLGIETVAGLSPDPNSREINDVVSKLDGIFDAVIGLGGGSSIDAAKALAVLLAERQKDIELFLNTGKNPGSALPIIAVPTTAGTGSEVSAGAIITRSTDNLKIGLRGSVLIPTLAVLDPRLTLTCPPLVTRDAGFDIFSHCFESFVSKKSNFLSDDIAIKTIDTVLYALPAVLDEPGNIELRSRLMFASFCAGINLLNIGTCLPHRIQYTFGIPVHVSHGEGIAIVYRSWLDHLATVEKLSGLSRVFSCGNRVEDVIESIHAFMDKLGFRRDYSSLPGFPTMEKYLGRLHGNLDNDPIYTPDMVKIIYSEITGS